MAKFCTTIEQSKKLTELGLSRETSDMFYWCGTDLRIGGYKAQDKDYDIPCWSLAALLNVLPYSALHKTFSGWRCDCYNKEGTSCTLGEPLDNPVDACVDTILKLKERNLI